MVDVQQTAGVIELTHGDTIQFTMMADILLAGELTLHIDGLDNEGKDRVLFHHGLALSADDIFHPQVHYVLYYYLMYCNMCYC